ncbi:MAG: hypothetical protein JWQ89_2196 [Devosia sp.]|nr:hypothetical protein [Devosia sp.]
MLARDAPASNCWWYFSTAGMTPAAPLVGGRHHAAPRGILLVHRHGKDAEPVVAQKRARLVALPGGAQLFVDGLGAAVDVEPAGHDAVGAEPALDAAVHRRPEPVEAGIERPAADPRLLVGPLHLGDRETGGACHVQHLGGVLERVGDRRPADRHLTALELGLADDEAAADRIVDTAEQQRAVRIIGEELQAVGVAGEPFLPVIDEVVCRPEAIGRVPFGMHHALGLDPCHQRIDAVRINLVRPQPAEPQHHRPAGAVADPGIGERTM